MPIIRDIDGRLWHATERATVPVLAVIHDHDRGGSVESARELGEASSLAEAEKMALEAGFRLRAPAFLFDAVNGIHVPVLRG